MKETSLNNKNDFSVITPQSSDAASQTMVRVHNFEGEVATEMAEDSLRY